MTRSSRRIATGGFVVLAITGVAAFSVALTRGASLRAWEAFLVNLLFWLGVAQGGVVVSASLYLTQARWGGASVYRLAESFAGFLPLGFLLFWLLLAGQQLIFPWVLHPLPQKVAWLNVPFLFGRDGGGLLLLTALSVWFVYASRRADAVEWAESAADIELPPATLRRLAPAVIIIYAIVYSLIAFDLVMSLSPIWYSTLFGAYFFAGAYWSALAAMGVLASVGWRPVPRGESAEHSASLHDIGKLVFAFSIFWAYLLWSQYLPIWYADIPEETFFLVRRIHALPWGVLAWIALLLIWLIPFIALLGKRAKRTPRILGAVCALGLIGMWIERYVLVVPSLSPTIIPFGWVEVLISAGFFGLFGLCTLPGLRLVNGNRGGSSAMKQSFGLILLWLLAGCSTAPPPMTTFAPKSDFAEWTQTLYLQVIGWTTLILVLVTVLTLLAIFRYSTRVRAPHETPPASPESLGLEVAWTVGPALVLLAIAIPTVRTTFRTQPAVAPANALIVNVLAHQWWWQIEYPDLEIRTANEIHLPAGQPVQIQLQSADIIHSFWVPALGGKRDVIPGHINTVTFIPRVPGVYLGQCAEFCGLSHANMRFRVFVDTPAEFDTWSTHQTAPAAVPGRPAEATDPVSAGARLYAMSACVTCHTINGVSTQKVGPDLTHFAGRTTLAGGILDNTPNNLAGWLRDPGALKPGAQMPKLGLSPEEVSQLVAYLGSLK